jgi:hypothetical protein
VEGSAGVADPLRLGWEVLPPGSLRGGQQEAAPCGLFAGASLSPWPHRPLHRMVNQKAATVLLFPHLGGGLCHSGTLFLGRELLGQGQMKGRSNRISGTSQRLPASSGLTVAPVRFTLHFPDDK